MHEVRLSESRSRVEIERVIDLARRLGDSQRSGVGKLVALADDKGVERVLGIEVRLLHGLRKRGLLGLRSLFFVGSQIVDIEIEAGDLGDRDLKRQSVLFIEHVNAHRPVVDDEHDAAVVNVVDLQRLEPDGNGDVAYIGIFFDPLEDLRPFFTDELKIIHRSSHSPMLAKNLR